MEQPRHWPRRAIYGPESGSNKSASTSYEHILDARAGAGVDYRPERLPATEVSRVVSVYFSIYEALSNELDGVKDARFLCGDPASVSELDLLAQQSPRGTP